MNRFCNQPQGKQTDQGLLRIMLFAFFTSGMASIMLGALLPYIKEVSNLNYTQSGLLLSAHQIGNLCAVIFSGILSTVIGRKYTSLLLGSGTCIGILLLTTSRNPIILLIAFSLTGISRGVWSNVCNTTVGDIAHNKAAGLNMLHAAFAVGALLSPVVVYAATGLIPVGWKAAAGFVGILSITVLVCVACSRMEFKAIRRHSGRSKIAFAFLRSHSFWFTAGILFFYLGAEASIVGWFVTYFAEAGILPPTAATFTPTMLWLMIMLGRMVCTILPSHIRKNRVLLIMALAFCAFFLTMLIARNGVISVVCLLGLGFFMAGIYPTTLSCMHNISSPLANGMVIGIATAGAIITPSVVGIVADWRGLTGGVAVILAACIGMLALILLRGAWEKKEAAKTAKPDG